MNSAAFRTLIAVATLFSLGLTPVDARSLSGQPLAEATKSDFFSFFHFKEVERKPVNKTDSLALFVTSVGGYDADLLVVMDTKSAVVTGMTLMLPRKFVQDPKWGVFARDVAKSFLRDGVADADSAAVASLVNEIAFGGQKSWSTTQAKEVVNRSTGAVNKDVALTKAGNAPLKKGDNAWIGVGAVPKLPAQQSPGYSAFLGQQEAFEKQYSQTRLRIKNGSLDGKQVVSLDLWKLPAKPAK